MDNFERRNIVDEQPSLLLSLERVANLENKVGFCLLKPDVVQLGVEDYLIHHISSKLGEVGVELDRIYMVELGNVEDVMAIYPNLDSPTVEPMTQYMCSGPCILLVYKSLLADTNLWNEIIELKGPTPWKWTESQLEGNRSIEDFVRAWVPVPGTIDIFLPIFEKALNKERFTKEEYYYYLQNLLHSPDSIEEVVGLINLLAEDEINELIHSIPEG